MGVRYRSIRFRVLAVVLAAESLLAVACLAAPAASSLAALRRQEASTRHRSRLSAVTFYRNLAVAGFRPEHAAGAG
jgi:hypothetical protein